MKVLIIEDEERGFSRLKRLLQNIDNSMEIQGPLTTMRAVIDYLQNPHDEDVIFADIRLGDGDVFEAFLEIAPTSPVIFTTAYNEYALEAFKSNGIAYLQKPILPEELEKALIKAKALCNKVIDYSALIEKMGMATGKKWRDYFRCLSMMASNLSRQLTLVIFYQKMVSLGHTLVMVILYPSTNL